MPILGPKPMPIHKNVGPSYRDAEGSGCGPHTESLVPRAPTILRFVAEKLSQAWGSYDGGASSRARNVHQCPRDTGLRLSAHASLTLSSTSPKPSLALFGHHVRRDSHRVHVDGVPHLRRHLWRHAQRHYCHSRHFGRTHRGDRLYSFCNPFPFRDGRSVCRCDNRDRVVRSAFNRIPVGSFQKDENQPCIVWRRAGSVECVVAPQRPDTSSVVERSAMNSRGERYPSALCG